MKAVILAGGYGTRISEESGIKPKPMVEIGPMPILWHIMKIYSHYGINDFVICLGYKGHVIKEFFSRYFLNGSDVIFDLGNNSMEVINARTEPWRITLIDTGENSMTGGRLKRAQPYVGNETFCLTYGDGVTDLNIGKTIEFHKRHKRLATLTAVQPPGRFGVFSLEPHKYQIDSFREKPAVDGDMTSWVNGGFFVLEPGVFDFIENDSTVFEQKPLEKLAAADQLNAYRHNGYWQPMDTLRDKNVLEDLWHANKAPWKVW